MRKHLRKYRLFKYIPTQESIRAYRFLKPLSRYLDHHFLWQFNRQSVAGGAAVGLFFSLASPVGQIPLAALFAILFRVNLPIAVFGTILSNPFTTPAFLYCAYKIGAILIGHEMPNQHTATLARGALPSTDHFSNALGWLLQSAEWVQSAGLPLVVGLGVLSAMLAVCGYVGVTVIWRLQASLRWRSRRMRRRSI